MKGNENSSLKAKNNIEMAKVLDRDTIEHSIIDELLKKVFDNKIDKNSQLSSHLKDNVEVFIEILTTIFTSFIGLEILRVDFNEEQKKTTKLRCILKFKFMPKSLLVEAGKTQTKIILNNDNNYNLNLNMEFKKDEDEEVKDKINDLTKLNELNGY